MFKFISAYFLPSKSRSDDKGSIGALKLSEERLSLAMKAGRMGVWEYNTQTREIYWDLNMFQLLGIEPCSSEEIHQIYYNGLNQEDYDKVSRLTQELTNHGKPFDIQYPLRIGDRVIYLQTMATSIREPDGQSFRIIGINRDISHEIEAQHALELERNRVLGAAKMASLGEMASNIAHEINNPLAIIMTRSHQLRKGIQDNETPKEVLEDYIQKIEATVTRISKIIKSLRSFSRDASEDPFLMTSFDKIMDEILELCGLRFKLANIDLEVEISPHLYLECRAAQIAQVILNLLNNAHDAVIGHTVKKIKIQAIDYANHIEIYVSDTGPSIAPETREKMMTPFFTTKPAGLGTGLGLTISKNIVSHHKGSLKLLNDREHTTFLIQLPKLQLIHEVSPTLS